MVFLFSIMPFRLLHFNSDLLAYLLQYVFRYRRKVVEDNLKKSFPEKTDAELKSVRRKFYSNLSDVLLEIVKSFSMPLHRMNSRIRLENPEILDIHFENKQSCIMLMSHYANWEWIPFTGHTAKHKNCALYKPLSNKRVDKFMRTIRERTGLAVYAMQQAGIMIRSNINKPALFTYITDQNPGGDVEEPYWIDFLNRKTAAIHGAEKMAVKFNLPVYYYDLQRIKRGRYVGRLLPLEMNPASTLPGEITTKYLNILEEIIRRKPEDWMWSHKRWKKKYPGNKKQA